MKNESENAFNITNQLGKSTVETPPQPQNSGLLLPLVLVIALLVTAAIIIPITVSKKSSDTKKFIYSGGNNSSNTTQKINKYIDLHCHLDGSITLDIAKKLAELQNITLPTNNDTELEALLSVPDDCENLNDFLKCFDLPLSLMQTPEGLTETVRLVAENIQSQGVIYAEFSLKVNLILCFMRGDNNDEKNEETLELAKKYLVDDGGVVALDLAGAEALYPTSKYKSLFAKAKEYGIPFTIHAGEAAGAESVKNAIEFGANRIGHGDRAYENASVVEELKNKSIPLEMCPSSTRLTHALEDMSKYPFMDFLEQGLKVTLNTDDMGIERTNIEKEFEYMEKNFDLTLEQEKIILLNSIEAAFTTDEVKAKLKKELDL